MNIITRTIQPLAGSDLATVVGGVFPIEYTILCPFPIGLPVEWPPMFPTPSWVLSV
jgi:hypothetical protein